MLLSYVQAAPNSDGSYHIQATSPAFPKGYTSGDVALSIEPRTCFIPSMRGSGRQYFELTEAEVAKYLLSIVVCLHAPQPQYSTADVEKVNKRIQQALDTAAKGEPKPATSVATLSCDEATIEKIVRAVLAALKS